MSQRRHKRKLTPNYMPKERKFRTSSEIKAQMKDEVEQLARVYGHTETKKEFRSQFATRHNERWEAYKKWFHQLKMQSSRRGQPAVVDARINNQVRNMLTVAMDKIVDDLGHLFQRRPTHAMAASSNSNRTEMQSMSNPPRSQMQSMFNPPQHQMQSMVNVAAQHSVLHDLEPSLLSRPQDQPTVYRSTHQRIDEEEQEPQPTKGVNVHNRMEQQDEEEHGSNRPADQRYCKGCGHRLGHSVTRYQCIMCREHVCLQHARLLHAEQCTGICLECNVKLFAKDDKIHPNRNHPNVTCVGEYQCPPKVFFTDDRDLMYSLPKKTLPRWTQSEQEAYANASNTRHFFKFTTQKEWMPVDKWPDGVNGPDGFYVTKHYLKEAPMAMPVYQVHNILDPTDYIKSVVDPLIREPWDHWRTWGHIDHKSRLKWWRQFDKLHSFSYPTQDGARIGVNYRRNWENGAGKKAETWPSTLFEEEHMDGATYRKHNANTDMLLFIAAMLQLLGETEYQSFYGRKYHRRVCNFLAYMWGGHMLPHKDVHNATRRAGKDGFDPTLIIIATLACFPTLAQIEDYGMDKGIKGLSYSGEVMGGATVYEGMEIHSDPGDVIMMGPPATTAVKHLVPIVQAEEAITMQWRRWIGLLKNDTPLKLPRCNYIQKVKHCCDDSCTH